MSLVNVKFENMKRVFDVLKNIKSEFILIPRVLIQTRIDSCIMGISNDSVVSIGSYEALEDLHALWTNEHLTYIGVLSKDIKNLMKFYNGSYDPSTLDYLIRTHDYNINSNFISIAYRLELRCNKECIYEVELYPYSDTLHKILFLYNMNLQGLPVMDTEVTNDPKFRAIVEAKSSDGAILWTPIMGYTMSLPSTLMKVNNGDRVYCSIRDGFEFYANSSFLVKFRIEKTKMRCKIDVVMMLLKVS